MCRQYLPKNCNNDDCQFYHPSICRNSRLNNFCDILHCRSYHFVGTYHPSLTSDYRYNIPHHNNNNDYTNCQAQNRNMNDHPYVNQNGNMQTNYNIRHQPNTVSHQTDYQNSSYTYQSNISNNVSAQSFLEV